MGRWACQWRARSQRGGSKRARAVPDTAPVSETHTPTRGTTSTAATVYKLDIVALEKTAL